MRIDLTGADIDQVSAVLDFVRDNSIYHEQIGDVLVVPSQHADEVRTLLVASKRRTTTDIYAYYQDGLQGDIRSLRDRWRARRSLRRQR